MNRIQRIQGVAQVARRLSLQTRPIRGFASVAVSRRVNEKCSSTSTLTTKPSLRAQYKGYATATVAAPTSGIVQFKLADVGEGIAECEILKWHVKVGDTVKEFDPLCEVQSDKATVEITSRYDGIIKKLYYQKGEMAKVGSPLTDIDLGSAGANAASPVVLDTIHAPDSAQAKAISQSQPHAQHAQAHAEAANLHEINSKVLATPSVRHIAKSNKINLTTVQGTGRDGRILKEDILAHQQLAKQPQAPQLQSTTTPSATSAAPSTIPPPVAAGQKQREQKQSMSGIKRVMARTMTTAALIPHFGYCDEFGMDGLQVLRAQLKPVAEAKGIKLTYMPFFIKAASLALLRYPTLNSSINADMTELTIKNYHNIGVAMDTPSGLLVPNIKDVQDKSLFEIAQELTRLHKAAVNNQLSPADMSGGTFTLSNIGTIGGTYASPVLVVPEVAIGAIGKIQKVPRYDSKGNLVPVHLLQVSWSADHRVIDGATMANFSNLMKLFVEKPESMLAELR